MRARKGKRAYDESLVEIRTQQTLLPVIPDGSPHALGEALLDIVGHPLDIVLEPWLGFCVVDGRRGKADERRATRGVRRHGRPGRRPMLLLRRGRNRLRGLRYCRRDMGNSLR